MDILKTFTFYINKNKTKSNLDKLKITVFSMLCGIVFGFIIISTLGYNPFAIFKELFSFSFKKSNTNTLLIFTAIYSLSGIANAFAFRTGLFNIGVPGQMIAGGATAMLFALTIFKGLNMYVAIPLLLIISILIAMAVGLLVGLLKSLFNVHEVVSTILINWIIFYLFKWIYRPKQSFVDQTSNSNLIPYKFYFGGSTESAWIASIVLVLFLSLIIFLVLKYTTYGRSIKMTGLNKDASEYSGINVKFATISSLAISAGFAGILGFVYYFAKQHFVDKFETTIPSYGFDGIAIAILAFNSPIIIPIISLFYAIFITGASGTSLPTGYQKELISLIFSFIIYFSAISSLFLRFKPIRFLRIIFIALKNDKYKNQIKEVKMNVNKINSSLVKEIISLRGEIVELDKSEKNKKKDLLKEIVDVKRVHKNKIKSIYKELFNNVVSAIDYQTKFRIKNQFKTTKFFLSKTLKDIKKEKINNLIYLEMNKSKNINKKELKNNILLIEKKYSKIKIDSLNIFSSARLKLKSNELTTDLFIDKIEDYLKKVRGDKAWL